MVRIEFDATFDNGEFVWYPTITSTDEKCIMCNQAFEVASCLFCDWQGNLQNFSVGHGNPGIVRAVDAKVYYRRDYTNATIYYQVQTGMNHLELTPFPQFLLRGTLDEMMKLVEELNRDIQMRRERILRMEAAGE